MNHQKLLYLLRSARHYFQPVRCPNCGHQDVVKADQKYFFTRLFECLQCHLLFRHPADGEKFNEQFYQTDYVQPDGVTTDLPGAEELNDLLNSDFINSSKNTSTIVKLWKALPGITADLKVVDYGSSWGYMSYQFRKMGISTQSFEISKPRAAFGNKHLGLDIKTNITELVGGNDIVFSAHVIEHVPSIPEMIHVSKKLLTADGYFMAECPNGSYNFRKHQPNAFHQGWGLVHPNYLSDRFYQYTFRNNPFLITSTPYDPREIMDWDGLSQVTLKTDGNQLMVISKPNHTR